MKWGHAALPSFDDWGRDRLFHSMNLIAVGLCEMASGLCHPWWMIRGYLQLQWILSKMQCIVDSCDPWGFPQFFRCHWESPCTALKAGKLPAVSAVQGNCVAVQGRGVGVGITRDFPPAGASCLIHHHTHQHTEASTKWLPFCRCNFQMQFLEWKIMYFD